MFCFRPCLGRKSIVSGKSVKVPKKITIADHFTDLIQQNKIPADGIALIGDHRESLWTPMQLDLTANRVAKAIRRLLGFWTNNNPDGDLVIGVCLHTTENAILMLLAILKLGASFVIFSTIYPEQQIVRMVGTVRPILIIIENDPQILSRFDCVKHITEIFPLYLIKDASAEFDGDPNDPVPLESLSLPWKKAASIVLTAGTTGEPRFVRIGHLAILNRLYWQYKAIPYKEGEVACLSNLLVDVESISEVFAPLLAGVPLYVIPRHVVNKPGMLLDRIRQVGITRIALTPTAINSLFKVMEIENRGLTKKKLDSIQYLIVSGAVLTSTNALHYFGFLAPECKLVYFYGATETMSEATWEVYSNAEDIIEKAAGLQISSGSPLHNCAVYILDEDLNLVPEGATGEICIAGTCLAMGFVGNADPSNSFAMYPPGTRPKSQFRIFRTGDYGRVTISAETRKRQLYYEGRIDMRMKINGKEVEMSDIQVAVHSTDLCEDCVVLSYHYNREDQAAVAFVILKPGVKRDMLTAALKKVLEDYMVPDVYPTTELPHLPNGKLDRLKLLKAYKFRKMECDPEDWEPLKLQAFEKQAAKILFEAIAHTLSLNLRSVLTNYQKSFWDIGGTSLNVLVIIGICQENGYLISLDKFVTAESLRALVQLMSQSGKAGPSPSSQLTRASGDLAAESYELQTLNEKDKEEVISLLSASYAQKGTVSRLLQVTAADYRNMLELCWDAILKEDLSVVAVDKNTKKIIGVGLSADVNSRHLRAQIKKVQKPLSYKEELRKACESVMRQTTIGNERGKVLKIFLLGTDVKMETKYNATLVEFLLKGCVQRAMYSGFSFALVISPSPLIRDLCGNILEFDLMAEVKLSSFVAKDKTKPFRACLGSKAMRAYYRLFT